MTLQPLPVTLSSSLTICQTIEGVLRSALGPNALHTMLTSSTGNVVITSDGHTLLTSLHLSHPLARWIVGQVRGHHTSSGDHTKSYVLLIAEILRQMRGALTRGRADATCSLHRQKTVEIGRALQIIQSEVFPRFVLPALLDDCLSISLEEANRASIQHHCEKIIQTAFGGKFSQQSTGHVVGLVVDLVCGSSCDIGSLDDGVQQLITDFDVLCWEIPNQPIGDSRLLDGVVLTRSFAVRSPDLDSLPAVPFVLLACSLDRWVPESRSTLTVTGGGALAEVLSYGTSRLEDLVRCLARKGLKLILSSELLSEAALSLCRTFGMSAVHMIPEEELQRLSRLTDADIAHEPSDLTSLALRTCSAELCRSVTVGNKTGIHLAGFGSWTRAPARHLVLCAPTQGICRQWFIAVFNALKVVRAWLDDAWCQVESRSEDGAGPRSPNRLKTTPRATRDFCEAETRRHPVSNHCSSSGPGSEHCPDQKRLHSVDSAHEADATTPAESKRALCVPGGGCTELLLHKLFRSLSRHDQTDDDFVGRRSPSLAVACGILGRAALCIPRTLHQNSFVAGTRTSSFLELVSGTEGGSAASVGIDGRMGALCNPSARGVLEPLSGRLRLWQDAIRTVQDLLRMDLVVGVRTMPRTDPTSSSSEDES